MHLRRPSWGHSMLTFKCYYRQWCNIMQIFFTDLLSDKQLIIYLFSIPNILRASGLSNKIKLDTENNRILTKVLFMKKNSVSNLKSTKSQTDIYMVFQQASQTPFTSCWNDFGLSTDFKTFFALLKIFHKKETCIHACITLIMW